MFGRKFQENKYICISLYVSITEESQITANVSQEMESPKTSTSKKASTDDPTNEGENHSNDSDFLDDSLEYETLEKIFI